MSKLLLFGILLLLVATSPSDRNCSCRKALEHDLPHGANEVIEYSETTVKSVRGQVSYSHDDSVAEDVVVEIYEITETDAKLNSYQLVRQRNRKFACITSDDGSFCFPHLPTGRYLVRAGTLSQNAGMNEVYMRVKVDRRWWSRLFRPNKKLKLSLTLGRFLRMVLPALRSWFDLRRLKATQDRWSAAVEYRKVCLYFLKLSNVHVKEAGIY